MAKITANNIQSGTITSDKLESSVVNNLTSVDNANTLATIATTVAAAAFSTANANAILLANIAVPTITSIQITDSSYNVLDDTAANTTGGYIVITGSGFTNTSIVVFGSTAAPAVSYISSTVLRAQTPALSAASYPVYVVNSNGATGIKINGLTTSLFPSWSTGETLSPIASNNVFGVFLSATSDSSITYENTSILPTGTTLAANGYFSGNVNIGVETTYTFTVKANDLQNQDNSRTFGVTVVQYTPQRLYAIGGNNNNSQLGLNDNVARSSPVQLGSEINWNVTHAGRATTFAVKIDGTLWAWGTNAYGMVGNNNYLYSPSSPVQIGSNTNWAKVTSGYYHILALRTDGTLWGWGRNVYGELGQNDTASRSSPTQIAAGTTWLNAVGTSYSTLAIKTDGTLWAWGNQANGVLGNSERTLFRSSPIQIGTLNNWGSVQHGGKIAAGSECVFVTKTDGTLWAWGTGSALGLNNTIYRSSPMQVGALTNWSWPKVAGENAGAVVLCQKTDNTLWTWGNGYYGALGTNSRLSTSSPVQLGTAEWSQGPWTVSGNGQIPGIGAIKTNNTLWVWGGINDFGQLGLNIRTAYRSSPIQLGTATNWNKVSFGYQYSFASTLN